MKRKIASIFLSLLLVAGIFAVESPGVDAAHDVSVIPAAILTTIRPIDSTPDRDGSNFFFTATGPGGNGIFRVSAQGGPVTRIMTEESLVEPRGIAVGFDNSQLYVTDPQAPGQGAIWVIPAAGGSAVVLPGSLGTSPQGITLISERDQDWVYFTGIDPGNGLPGVFKLPAAGAQSMSIIAEGAPLVNPDGVAVNRQGTVFISDRFARSVFKINNGIISVLVDKIMFGTPAGVALTENEQTLLISALNSTGEHAQILLLDLRTLTTTSITQVVSRNQGAGGIHRALNDKIFSWCGIRGSSSGTIYQVSL